jgi:hypothetical protein
MKKNFPEIEEDKMVALSAFLAYEETKPTRAGCTNNSAVKRGEHFSRTEECIITL